MVVAYMKAVSMCGNCVGIYRAAHTISIASYSGIRSSTHREDKEQDEIREAHHYQWSKSQSSPRRVRLDDPKYDPSGSRTEKNLIHILR